MNFAGLTQHGIMAGKKEMQGMLRHALPDENHQEHKQTKQEARYSSLSCSKLSHINGAVENIDQGGVLGLQRASGAKRRPVNCEYDMNRTEGIELIVPF